MMEKIVTSFDEILEKMSRWSLIISLYLILGLAVLSIVLRWAGLSPLWIDPLIRHLVFLSAFLGGSLATSKGVHIKVDLLTHFIENSRSKVLHWLHRNLVTFFCFATTLVLTKASWDFFLIENEFGSTAFLGIHSSYLVSIITVGMGLICLRFFNKLLIGLMQGESRDHLSV
jgi:TRAP-type C4-dicarboxylate transport system permease small subunit